MCLVEVLIVIGNILLGNCLYCDGYSIYVTGMAEGAMTFHRESAYCVQEYPPQP